VFGALRVRGPRDECGQESDAAEGDGAAGVEEQVAPPGRLAEHEEREPREDGDDRDTEREWTTRHTPYVTNRQY
jgi:hypothetical protein